MKHFIIITLFTLFTNFSHAQKTPTGNPADFKVKTCLHSVSYHGIWRGQTPLSVDEFLVKAKELGYEGVMLVAKRPHVSPHDYDKEARKKLKERIEEYSERLKALDTDVTNNDQNIAEQIAPVEADKTRH